MCAREKEKRQREGVPEWIHPSGASVVRLNLDRSSHVPLTGGILKGEVDAHHSNHAQTEPMGIDLVAISHACVKESVGEQRELRHDLGFYKSGSHTA